MRTCEVAVIGLGVMGSAALRSLVARGVDAVGFDPIRPGDQRGSSHGSCRIFRRFNFESPAYTALSDRASDGWATLEAECGRSLLKPLTLVEAGVPGSALVAATRAAAGDHASGPRTGAALNAAWPAFNVPDDWEVAVQDTAGILLADRALAALRAPVADRIVYETVRLERSPSALTLTTSCGEGWSAGQVIVAAGAWACDFEPRLKPHLKLTRQVVGWFEPANPKLVQYPDFPLFILDAHGALTYGFPDFEGQGVKAANHVHGRRLGHADEASQDARDEELAVTEAALRTFIPAAAGRIRKREVCLYTNTRPGDVDGSAPEEFILDRIPDDPCVILASICSGHGFKFAPAIGEMLAELATDARAVAPPAFRLGRFSSFA